MILFSINTFVHTDIRKIFLQCFLSRTAFSFVYIENNDENEKTDDRTGGLSSDGLPNSKRVI